ncbi:hypothetical protein GOV03_03595 [Candidatus Woesearchaeota archaeon]|nr:hypothetical protein [Candidatus Woesearchaeota archaeon]
MDKRGQGLSLTTIIVAAIALIVLVVLVMIFTGRIGIFQEEVGDIGQAELVKLQISYGDCHPSTTVESTFTVDMDRATSEVEKEDARNILKTESRRCKSLADADTCNAGGCSWK